MTGIPEVVEKEASAEWYPCPATRVDFAGPQLPSSWSEVSALCRHPPSKAAGKETLGYCSFNRRSKPKLRHRQKVSKRRRKNRVRYYPPKRVLVSSQTLSDVNVLYVILQIT